jgi:hypothetical protein
MHPDRVYHVEHVVMIDGAKHYAVTDMMLTGEQLIAVLVDKFRQTSPVKSAEFRRKAPNGREPSVRFYPLVWGGKPGKEYPLVSVRLDLAHLSEHRDGRITHRYELPTEDSRR